jgi:hypothetical protein
VVIDAAVSDIAKLHAVDAVADCDIRLSGVEGMDAFGQAVIGQGVVGHQESLVSYVILLVVIGLMVIMMYKWNTAWKDSVKRHAMLVLHGLHLQKKH